MIYAKYKYDKRFGPIDIHSCRIGVGLAFATRFFELDRAKSYADRLMVTCPDFLFQVRTAGKSRIIYIPSRNISECETEGLEK